MTHAQSFQKVKKTIIFEQSSVSMELLKSQKNQLFEIIQQSGLSPMQFDFNYYETPKRGRDLATILRYIDSEFYYSFERIKETSDSHYAVFSPGRGIWEEEAYPGSWGNQLTYFNDWLTNLKIEITTPDKWERLYSEVEAIELNFEDDRNFFTVPEYEEIKQRIKTIEGRLSEISLIPEQLEKIISKLDQVAEMAKTMNKFDWKSQFIGALVSIIIQLSITPENAKAIWNIVKGTFSQSLFP